MNLLIVGANSASGQEICKQLYGKKDVQIIGTTSSLKDISFTDKTIHEIDLSNSGAVAKIVNSIKEKIDYIIYIPARGMVGMPTKYSTREMILESFRYSIFPYLELTKDLTPKKTILLSGFITMPPMLLCYGCMALTKIIMEELAFEFPTKFTVIRLGMFYSKSVRGIALATRKNIKDRKYPELLEMQKEWKNSGLSFDEYFYGKNWYYEESIYKDFANNKNIPFRKTETKDIATSVQKIIDGDPNPVWNVLGDWVWKDKEMIPVPEEIKILRKYISTELDTIEKMLSF